MRKTVSLQKNEYLTKSRRKKQWICIIAALSCFTVLCTVYAMMLPAITMEKQGFFASLVQAVSGTDGDFTFPEVSQQETTSGNYWVKCTSEEDLEYSSPYMIVSSSGAALGISSETNQDVKSYEAKFTQKGTTDGKPYYELSGAADTDLAQFKLTGSDTSWKVMCANSEVNSYGMRIGSRNLSFKSDSDITTNTFTLKDSTNGIWRIHSDNCYLIYSSNFAKGSDGDTANMTIYRQITVYNQLAVQKSVSEYTSAVTAETEFTFKLSSSGSESYESASSVTDVNYTIYNGAIASDTGTLTDGTFTLKGGQTAYFELPQSDTVHYFVSEVVENTNTSIQEISAEVNDTATTLNDISDSSTTEHYVPVSYSSEGQCLVCVTNTPVPDESPGECYTITFDFNDGTTTETRTTSKDGTISEAWPTKTRSGYTFKYWSTTADDEDTKVTESTSYKFDEDTTLYAHWESTQTDPEDNSGASASLTKELRESTAYNDDKNYENLFDIDLGVTSSESQQIEAIVLVVDLSSSMYKLCMECGMEKEEHDGQAHAYTGWDGTSVDHTACDEYVERVGVVINQATTFINEMEASLDGRNCYVSIVGFNRGAFVILDEANLGTDTGFNTIKSCISNLKSYTGSGTALAQGMYQGYLRLQDLITTHGVNPANSCVMLMSDGVPNTIKSEDAEKFTVSGSVAEGTPAFNDTTITISRYLYVGDGAATYANADPFLTTWKEIWSKYDHYEWYETTSTSFHRLQVMAPPYIAEQIREKGSKLYTLIVGENVDNGKSTSANAEGYVFGLGLTNYDYLESFSDDIEKATDEDQLTAYYSRLIKQFVSTVSKTCVTDPMSDYVEFAGFTAGTDGDTKLTVSSDGTVLSDNETLVASYNSSTRTITWNPAYDGTISYKVRLKNEAYGFIDWDDSAEKASYVTNGKTTIEYKLTAGSSESTVTKTVEVPSVHGWLGELQFTKVGGTVNDSTATVLSGVTFTLHHDPDSCPICQNLSSDIRASIEDIEVTSNDEGVVSFENVPSGHSYTMTEETPEGYSTGASYIVKVAYGETTVTPVGEDNGYWSLTDGKYRLFNLKTSGYVLPEAGGRGTLMFIFGGLFLMTGACVYGYRLRHRRERRTG